MVKLLIPIIFCIASSSTFADSDFSIGAIFNPKESLRDSAAGPYQNYINTKKPEFLAKLQAKSSQNNPYAMNYFGCIYYNGINVKQDRELAARYFLAASNQFPLAAHNYGVYLQSKNNKSLAKDYFYKAYTQGGYEQSGSNLLNYYVEEKRDIETLLSELTPLESPNALLILSYRAAQAKRYREALDKSMKASGQFLVPAFQWDSQIYFNGWVGTDKAHLAWGWYYNYLYYAFSRNTRELPPLEQIGLSPMMGGVWSKLNEADQKDAQVSGYHEAVNYFNSMGEIKPRYTVAVCEPDNRVAANREFSYK